jgi:hypothetical protein
MAARPDYPAAGVRIAFVLPIAALLLAAAGTPAFAQSNQGNGAGYGSGGAMGTGPSSTGPSNPRDSNSGSSMDNSDRNAPGSAGGVGVTNRSKGGVDNKACGNGGSENKEGAKCGPTGSGGSVGGSGLSR